jgi:hypothetical protein
MKYEDEQFEGLLNDSLKEVQQAEPRSGLEGRILANIRSDDREEKSVLWKWVAVTVMVMLIVLGIAVRRGAKNDVVEIHPTRTVPEMPKSLPPPKDAQARGILHVGPVAGLPKKIKPRAIPVEAPMQRVESASARVPFPAPAPLSKEEKALVMLAQNHPQVVRSVGIDSTSDDRLAIPKIKIEPIKVSEDREEER